MRNPCLSLNPHHLRDGNFGLRAAATNNFFSPYGTDNRTGTPNCLTFVKTTAIAYHQNPEALVDFLPICNSSRFYKIQAIRSTGTSTDWSCKLFTNKPYNARNAFGFLQLEPTIRKGNTVELDYGTVGVPQVTPVAEERQFNP